MYVKKNASSTTEHSGVVSESRIWCTVGNATIESTKFKALSSFSAKPFEEVQKKVADLLKDRILVAHAVHNDLKALLLSHPRPQIRDTQFYAHKFGLCKTKRVALRNLVKQEVGITIQSGEHSSVGSVVLFSDIWSNVVAL